MLSNWLAPHTVKHSDSILAIIVKLLKPSGKLILKDAVDLTSTLKLNGFVNVTKSSDNLYLAEKPKFEVSVTLCLHYLENTMCCYLSWPKCSKVLMFNH